MGFASSDGFDHEAGDDVSDGVVGVAVSRGVLRAASDTPGDDFLGFEGGLHALSGLGEEADVKGVFGETVGVVEDLTDREERGVVGAVEGVASGPVIAEIGGDGFVEVDETVLNQLKDQCRGHGLGDGAPAVVVARIGVVAGGDIGETGGRGDLHQSVAVGHEHGDGRAGGTGAR